MGISHDEVPRDEVPRVVNPCDEVLLEEQVTAPQPQMPQMTMEELWNIWDEWGVTQDVVTADCRPPTAAQSDTFPTAHLCLLHVRRQRSQNHRPR